MIARRRFVASLVAFVGCVVAPIAQAQSDTGSPSPTDALSRPQLLAALKRGGYVIYFRHTSTDFGQNDEGMTSLDDCVKQRNLTEQGRAEARAIGAAIAKLQIPIGEVLASPFCRTIETAKLIFGRATISNAVRGWPIAQQPADRYAGLRELLSASIQPGTNLAIVSHGNPFRVVAGTPYLAEGEAAIVEPRGREGFRIVARVAKDAWNSL